MLFVGGVVVRRKSSAVILYFKKNTGVVHRMRHRILRGVDTVLVLGLTEDFIKGLHQRLVVSR